MIQDTSEDPTTLGISPKLSATYRFSGHQTFPLRISWIPKAIAELSQGRDPLNNIDEGIVTLGLGKNMVEALNCWLQAFGVAKKENGHWSLTAIGKLVFTPTSGLDPFLEDYSTSWVLHWLICTKTESPFFAWECLFNRWPSVEFTSTAVLDAFRRESAKVAKSASPVTLKQHLEVFLHSYRPPRGGRGEDHLDCVLSVLGIIEEIGERQNAHGKWETLYGFDLSIKSSIPQQLFAFFIHDWWNRKFPAEQSVTLREVVNGEHSPGRLLRMQEPEVLSRLSELSLTPGSGFEVTESANLRLLRRSKSSNGFDDLRSAYRTPRYV